MYGLNRYMIDINIETLAGTTFSLKVSPLESVQSVKAKIQRHEGIPISHQHLIWQSNELDDKCTLSDYNIPNGSTIRMVLALRGGPINTRRMTTDDALIRDVSDLMEINEDSNLWNNNDSSSHSNKHVTLLLFRDGDHLNLLRVIDRGDANSPISGAMSAASMYVPFDETDHDTISVANNLEDILASAPGVSSSITELQNPQKSANQSQKIKLLSKRKKSTTNENLKTKEKMVALKQKLKSKSEKEKIEEDRPNDVHVTKVESSELDVPIEQKKKLSKIKKSASQTNLKENDETDDIEPDEIDDDEFTDEEYLADEYLEDDEYEDDDEEDYEDDEEVEEEEEEDNNHYFPNLSQTSENVNQLESEYAPEEDEFEEEENELLLNKSEFLLNEDQQPARSPNSDEIPSSLATTALPTVNTPTDTEQLQTPYSGRINKNGLLSSKLEYLKNRRKVDSKVPKTENEEEIPENQDDSKQKKNRRKKTENENDKPRRRRRAKRYEITSFSPTTILVKTVSLDPSKKTLKKIRQSELDEPIVNRIVSSSQKRVSFSVHDDANKSILDQDSKIRPLILNKKPPSKLDALYKPVGEEISITSLPVKNNQLNPILKSSNRLEILKNNLSNSASILKPYQPNPILAPILDNKSSERIFSASSKQKPFSFSANDLTQTSKSTIKLPPVIGSTNSSNENILIAGSSNNLNSIGLNEVKKKVNDMSRYCYFCKKKTGLASSYMCRCGNNYCTQHRNAEAHSCTFDYKTEGRKLIEQSNPLVAAPKLPKI